MSGDWPIGSSIDPAMLGDDWYTTLARLREREPVSWIERMGLYYVTRYEDVVAVLRDDATFAVGADNMLVFDTFGRHMMTIDGPEQARLRLALRGPFAPRTIRERLEGKIEALVDALIDGFAGDSEVELRRAFACRLPVQVMLSVFGLPQQDEPLLRKWYDAFEAALGNYGWDETIRVCARACVGEFKAHLQDRLSTPADLPPESLLAALIAAPPETRLSEDDILQNALIIFFGGISTVEALILNTLYALALHPSSLLRVKKDVELLPRAIEESARWLSPVQAATRVARSDTKIGDVEVKAGALVNCMLGSANRDASVFVNPERFDLDRENLNRHVAFATGPHTCLGSNLARTEVRVALTRLFARLSDCRVDLERTPSPEGYEFLQPAKLQLTFA